MRRNRLSLVLFVFSILAIGNAQASSISQRPQRFESHGSRGYASSKGSTFLSPSSPDNWLGGAGNWSNGADWSAGLPSSNSDVSINTGNDNVTLDTSSSINSLTLGGSTGSSQLTGDGNAHTVTIAGALTINQSGNLYLSADSAMAAATFSNVGTASVEFGSSLQISGNVINSGTLNEGISTFSSGNVISIGGTLTNSGTIQLGSFHDFLSMGGSTTVTGLANTGTLGLAGMGNLTVNGDANNAGAMLFGDGVPTLSVTGNFINTGTLQTTGDDEGQPMVSIGGTLTNTSTGSFSFGGDITAGSLVNQGQITIDPAEGETRWRINGSASNSGTINIGYGNSFGDQLLIAGSLTNSAGAQLNLVDDGSVISAVSVVNSGTINLHGLNGGTLQVSGNAQNSGSISVGGYLDGMQAASLTNSGSIQIANQSELQVSGDVSNSGVMATEAATDPGNTIFIAGKLTNSTGGTFELNGQSDVANVAYITNAGMVSLAGGTGLNVTGGAHAAINALPGFLNSGIVNLYSGSTLSSPLTYTQTGGQTTVDGTLRVSSRGTINFAGGSVYGDQGTIQGKIVSNAAINIGDSPLTIGQLAFNGNYTQGANGSLTFDIAGSGAGEYDQLNVSGNAQLNGLMTVDLLHGYVPQVGNMFDIMNFASSSGNFSMVAGLPINGQEHFVLEYNSTNLTLDVVSGQLSGPAAAAWASSPWEPSSATGSSQASEPFIPSASQDGGVQLASNISNRNEMASTTPEPGSIVLFGSGIVGLASLLRRRRSV